MAIPAQSPNCNPYAERFVRTVREECLDQFVIFGEAHLRHLLAEFVQHYNRERYHQGKGGKLVMPNLLAVNDSGAVAAIKRLLTGFVASADTRTDHLVSSAREQSLAAGAGGSSTL